TRDISNRAYCSAWWTQSSAAFVAVAPACRRPCSAGGVSASVWSAASSRSSSSSPAHKQMPEVLLRVPVSQLLSVAYRLRQAPARAATTARMPTEPASSAPMSVHARIHASGDLRGARQLLQLAYTEATLEFFDRAPRGAASTSGGAPSTSGASVLGGGGHSGAGGWQRRQRQGRRRRSPRTATDSNATPPVIGRRDNPQEAVSSLAGSLASSLSRQELVTFGQLFRAWSSGASSFAGSVRPQLERLPTGYSRSVSIGSTASSVRSRDSSEVDLDQALGSIVAQVQRLDMSQQQFAQPSYSRSVSAASASTAGRSPGQPHKYLALDGLEDSASMVAPADSGEGPVKELSPMGHAHRF
uniref:Autophagy-related protein 13 n=1 Tax=Macrostomum lignano TaxID=282301 RepID=A0A1I8FRY9_9PLAT